MTKLKHKVDMPSVTEDEALELMIHHLSLAAAYYEATPSNYENNWKEVNRILGVEIPNYANPALVAAEAWLRAMDLRYEEMEKVSKNAV